MIGRRLQKDSEVRIIEEGHKLSGEYGCVCGVSGDNDSLGDTIPDGWVEIQFTGTQYRELFKEEDVVPARKTL